MINKKTLAVTALALLISQQSFAYGEQGFYLGGGYHNQIINRAPLEATTKGVTEVLINDRNTVKTKGQELEKYKADYNPPFATNFTLGYAGELKNHHYRAELEGMYSLVKVDNIGLASSQMVVSYAKNTFTNEVKDMYATEVNHDQIENASVMANVYHHWQNDRFSFSPYVGVGAGATRIKIWEQASIRPAYQLKAGFSYSLTPDTYVHVGYRHFGAIGTNLKLKANKRGTKQGETFTLYEGAKQADTINISNKLFSTHGLELGLTVHFSSGA